MAETQRTTSNNPSALTIVQAAAALGATVAQLRAWIRAGAPTVRAGQRGRGHTMLVDVADLSAWLKAREQAPIDESHRVLARDLIEAVADALITVGRARADVGKVRDIGATVTEFAAIAGSIHERLGLPELTPAQWPLEIQKMFAALKHFQQVR